MNRWSEIELAEVLSRNPQVRISRGVAASKPTSASSTIPPLEPEKPVTARKYRNEPVTHEGMKFDSKKEFQRFLDLSVMERAGVISELTCHPKYVFEHNGVRIASYKADFAYFDGNGAVVVEDVKSEPSKTQAYRLRKKMMKAFFGISVIEV